MGMVTLQAKMAFPYAGRSLAEGDTFLASEKDAAILKTVGRAIDAPPPRLRRKDVRAAESSDETPDATKTRRQYQRRDLEAEP